MAKENLPSLHFKEQVIWLTGASSGIGEALVHALAPTGCKLVLSARRGEALKRVALDAKLHPEACMILPLDLEQPKNFPALAQEVFERFGRIDMLINNGGISQRSLVMDTSLEVVERLMRINYTGTVALTHAVLPYMLAKNHGQVVVVTSLVGKFGTPYRSAYSASKHALHGYFDSLRAELHDKGLVVTLLCPGFIKTQVSINALTGDGSPLGTMDDAQKNGMPAKVFAKKAIQAIAEGKDEVYIGGRERHYVLVRRLLPGVFTRMLRRAKVR